MNFGSCGRWRNGRLVNHCTMAGTEECDFECAYRDAPDDVEDRADDEQEPTDEQLKAAGFDLADDLDRPDRHCDCLKCKAFYDAIDGVTLGAPQSKEGQD